MIWHANVVRELLFEPLEGREGTVIIIEEHVVGADLVPLARAVVVPAVLLLLFSKLTLVASQAGPDLLLFSLRHRCPPCATGDRVAPRTPDLPGGE